LKTTRVLASMLVACGISATAVAAPPVMLNNAIITQIPKADRNSFHEAVAQSLNSSADGQRTEWSSTHQRQKAPPITVQLTPTQTSKVKNDQTCRFLVGDFARGATTEKWQFWFCKQPDGTWKASSN
jgi:surface antigen